MLDIARIRTDVDYAHHVAQLAHLSEDEMRAVAAHKDPFVAYRLIARVDLPLPVKWLLVDTQERWVVAGMVKAQADLPEGMLRVLARSEYLEVVAAAVEFHVLPEDSIRELAARPEWALRVTQYQVLPPDLVRAFVMAGNWDVLLTVAASQPLPADIVERMSACTDERIASVVQARYVTGAESPAPDAPCPARHLAMVPRVHRTIGHGAPFEAYH